MLLQIKIIPSSIESFLKTASKKMMLQKKLNASWTTKIRSSRMRSDDAGAHDQKQYALDNGESADTRNKALPPSGCVLKWSSQEHILDCPCHGSRFEEDGKRIDSPAAEDLKF